MARTSVATDNFNRSTLGANWAQLNTTWGNIIPVAADTRFASDGTAPVSGTGNGAARWVGSGTFTDDQYSSIIITGFDFQSANYNVGVIVRASADTTTTRDYYGFSVAADGAGPTYTTTLYKIVNGTYTTLNSAAQTWANGDELSIEVEGTTVRGCRNGTPLGGSWTQTDSSLSTGAPGISAGGSSVLQGDNWEGGNLGSGGSTLPPQRLILLSVG